MRAIQAIAIVLTQLSLGSLIITSLLSPWALPRSFFLCTSLGCAASAALALVLTKYGADAAWWEMRYLGLTVIGATAGYGCYRLEKLELGRLCLIFAALLGLVFGLLPLGGRALVEVGWQTRAPWLFGLPMVIGAIVLGLATVGWLLLAWYRQMRQLAAADFVQYGRVMLGVVGLRLLVMVGVLAMVSQVDPAVSPSVMAAVWGDNLVRLRFVARVATGFVLPVAMAIVLLRQAAEESDQPSLASVGWLWGSLLIGELLAAFVLI